MTYDATLDRILMFGGAGTDGVGLGDTWTWDGSNWTQVADTGPAPRAGAAMVFGGGVLLFGGMDSVDAAIPGPSHKVYGDTWRWEASQWTQVQDIGPKGRWLHAMGFDAGRSSGVLFGGLAVFAPSGDLSMVAGLLADTWEIELGGDAGSRPLVEAVSISSIGFPLPPFQALVEFTLRDPAPPGGLSLEIAIYREDDLSEPVPVPGFVRPTSVEVQPGESAGQFTLMYSASEERGGYTLSVGLPQPDQRNLAVFEVLD
jgi:hypothetical protein